MLWNNVRRVCVREIDANFVDECARLYIVALCVVALCYIIGALHASLYTCVNMPEAIENIQIPIADALADAILRWASEMMLLELPSIAKQAGDIPSIFAADVDIYV